MKVNLHREKSRGTSGRRGRFDLPAAVLTALAVQIFFWLPLEYREERIAAADNGDNISVLGPGSFSADGLRRFEIWMKRHDPAAFSRSDSSSGYAASLPEIQPQELPAVIAPAAAAANIAMAVEGFKGRGYAQLGGIILNRRNVKNEEASLPHFFVNL